MDNQINQIVLIATLIFLIAPAFLIAYIIIYNRRKKQHLDETIRMKTEFEEELVKTKMEIQEQTMQTIGYDLHDNIGQLLSLTSLTLKSIKYDDAQVVQNKVASVIDLTTQSIQELRLLGKLLQGEQLVGQGLERAIEHHLNWLNKADQYQIQYDHSLPGHIKFDINTELIIFRLFQEIINNIIKHAGATEVMIRFYAEHDSVVLTIKDNGVGFDIGAIDQTTTGMGLSGIQRRAQLINGVAEFISAPGSGTTIVLKIPYAT